MSDAFVVKGIDSHSAASTRFESNGAHCFRFDPNHENLDPPPQGYRLEGHEYVFIHPDQTR